jgi:predicted hydrolase (HD superfamily)
MTETTVLPSRDEALALLHANVRNENLRCHALAVEAVMRQMARRYAGNEPEWGLVGLVHDLDWERFPDQHCRKSRELLEAAGWPAYLVRAVVSHGWGICSEVEPQSLLEKSLYAVDELTGLVTACALVRPSKSVLDLEVKSVKKKWKVTGFAAGANREVIETGAERLGLPLDELMAETIAGMRIVAAEIGLKGTL